jgi:hypothetical protein
LIYWRRSRRPVLERLEERACPSFYPPATPVYGFEVLAQRSRLGMTQLGEGILPTIGFNNAGEIAILGHYHDHDSLFLVSTGNASPVDLAAGVISPGDSLGTQVGVNNLGQVLVVRSSPESNPATSSVLEFDARHGGYTTVATGGPATYDDQGNLTGSPYDFETIYPYFPAVSDGDAAFVAATIPPQQNAATEYVLASPAASGTGGFDQTPLFVPLLRPRITNDGHVLYFDPNLSAGLGKSQIVLLSPDLQQKTVIASASQGFSNLGSRPGISDDGTIVVFYGELSAEGASQLTQANGDVVPFPVTPGPGIFASVQIQGHRYITRIAGMARNGQLDPGECLMLNGTDVGPDFNYDSAGAADWEIGSFDGSQQVSVAYDSHAGDATVAYLATDTIGGPAKSAIYTSRINIYPKISNLYVGSVGVEPPILVTESGRTIGGNVISDLTLDDSVNVKGQVAFLFASRQNGLLVDQEIVRATLKSEPASQARYKPDSPLVDYVIRNRNAALGSSSRQGAAINQIIIHATGGNERNSIQSLSGGAGQVETIHYIISREGCVTQIIREAFKANHAGNPNAATGKTNLTNRYSVGIELVDDGGHRSNPNWATPIELKKLALLVRDIALRNGIYQVAANGRPRILHPAIVPENNFAHAKGYVDGFRSQDTKFVLPHLAVGPYEVYGSYMEGTKAVGAAPARFSDGYNYTQRGVLAHGQVLDRLRGKNDPTIFNWLQFMRMVNEGISGKLI